LSGVLEQNPPKQGLKLKVFVDCFDDISSFRAKSTKTRIETGQLCGDAREGDSFRAKSTKTRIETLM